MNRSNRELWLALITMTLITAVYLAVVQSRGGIPEARGFFGHSLGIIGLLLMLMTETLYSFRKRSRTTRWGRMSVWLQFHIFTGLVGPYLVLLHTSWQFRGLAGVVTLFTGIIVLSGLVGRYLFTAIPRAPEGHDLDSGDRSRNLDWKTGEMGSARRALAVWYMFHIPLGIVLFLTAFVHVLGALYFATFLH